MLTMISNRFVGDLGKRFLQTPKRLTTLQRVSISNRSISSFTPLFSNKLNLNYRFPISKINVINSKSLVYIPSITSGRRFYVTESQSTRSQNNDKGQSSNESDAENIRRKRTIAGWLFTCCGLVFGMVVLGGITRLTESGLSIVDWKPIVGSIPPRTREEWEEEFAKYKQSPEYQKLNFGMSLEDFKKIFWMEWAHRELGRFIGAAFGVPLAVFVAKGWIRGKLLAQCCTLLAMGGMQGALGWYMVKSGLDHKTFEETNSVPRVSQYRLAAHLTSALVLYSSMLWIAMGLVSPPLRTAAVSSGSVIPLQRAALGTVGLVFTTAFSGAFVAGLDAGLIYNTFPLMGEQLVPEGLFAKQPLWRNFFENDTTVQFNHRVLGISTFTGIVAFYYWAMLRKNGIGKQLPRSGRLAFHSLLGMSIIQVTLGISTLLSFVPVPLAASHQAGALSLLSISLWLAHQTRRLPK